MSFLTPAFFLGALALAIPIIIHLTNREKKEVVDFPSLMFLRRIPYRSVRRQRLRHLLLFALRCLALLLLILAFARPFLESPTAASALSLGPREVVFVLDHSYSMGYEDRLERAKDEIRRQIAMLSPDERASVVVFSDRAEISNQPTSDKDQLRAIVNGVTLSARTTRYGPALKLAKKIVDESSLTRKEVFLLTDFQRLGWEGDEDVWFPADTKFTTIDVGSPKSANLAVTGVILERKKTDRSKNASSSVSVRERLIATARVTYKAPDGDPPVETNIRLLLNGRSLQSKKLQLAPNSSTTVSFDPLTLPGGVSRGTVQLDADKLEIDNAYHFVLWPGQSLNVLSLDGNRGRSLYVDRALAIGDRPSFRLESKRMSQLGAADLAGRHVVLLNDVASFGAARARLLERFVKEGGGLIIALGEASGRNSFTGDAARLLPAPLGGSTDRARDWGGTLSYLDYGSPVFEIFGAPHSGDFSAAKFFRYRTFEGPISSGILARYDDGAVALAEKTIGEGRVLVWTSTLDTFWNDLALQPVFLPFLHQLIKYAAGYAEVNAWHTVGEVADLEQFLAVAGEDTASDGERKVDLVVSSPSGTRTIIPPSEERALLSLSEQGFYEIRQAGSGSGTAVAMALASNLDLTESDLAKLDPEELVASVTFRDLSAAAPAAGETVADREGRQGFWWYLLVAAFIALAMETILSNRLSRARTVVSAVG